jgi:dimethylhistidine N-methyltransferase
VKDGFLKDVLEGLSGSPKSLPSKYFYDAEGSRLFEAITALPEYYPTRTETALLQRIAPELSAHIPDGATLVEFGSGASVKTRLVLDAAPQIARYVPIDISRTALAEAAEALRRDYPALTIQPLVGDFTQALQLPRSPGEGPRIGFFPGSTLGNFGPRQSERLLTDARALLGDGSRFFVGIDLVKDEATLVAAYDDAAGVTAAFNRNVLVRVRRELAAEVDPDAFDHRAVWNAAERRIEMHLAARIDLVIHVEGRRFEMKAGETIHTENSRKFDLDDFAAEAGAGGWRVETAWREADPAYALVLLAA